MSLTQHYKVLPALAMAGLFGWAGWGFSCPRGSGCAAGQVFGDRELKAARIANEDQGWTKYAGNPVFLKGSGGEWDSGGVTCFVVRHFPWGYMMWYSCAANFERGFGLATSEDGIAWTRHPDNPVMAVDTTVTIWGPEVLHDGERYHMWYVSRGPDLDGISHATSQDGVTWVQSENNPVIPDGGCNAVIWDGENYRMLLQTQGFNLLMSPDGETWDDRGLVYPAGRVGLWDEIIAAPSLAYYEDALHLWYTGADTIGNQRGQIAIGHAVSGNWGESWRRDPGNPILRPSERWEGRGLYSSGIDYDGVSLYIWFAATGPQGGFGYASREMASVGGELEPDRGGLNLWSLSPNPSAGAVKLNYLGTLDFPVSVGIFDLAGRRLFSRAFAPNEPIRMSPAAIGLVAGQYLVKISTADRDIFQRLVLVK
jgi:hypothetical protein